MAASFEVASSVATFLVVASFVATFPVASFEAAFLVTSFAATFQVASFEATSLAVSRLEKPDFHNFEAPMDENNFAITVDIEVTTVECAGTIEDAAPCSDSVAAS